jgi:hypothetical protein
VQRSSEGRLERGVFVWRDLEAAVAAGNGSETATDET